jgi:V/A-type H+/Na+-transporting ATPase subunit K
MISKRFARFLFFGTFLGVLLIPAMAFAQEAAAAGPTTMADATKTMAAALAMGLSAIGAGWAQARIGSAGQGTLAERPEERVFVLTLTALPEVIALLGFVMAIILNG